MKRAAIAFFLCAVSAPAFASKELIDSKIDGKSAAEISVWVAATRTKVSKLAEAAKKKNPNSVDAKVWTKALESPALKK